MNRYKPELALAAVLLALFAGVWHWQAPGTPLDAAQTERYIAQIDRLAPMPDAEKAELFPRLRAWAAADDGRPVYMLNLMRYYDRLQPWPGSSVQAASPEAANAYYEGIATRIALPIGLSMTFAGATQGVGDTAGAGTNLFGHDPDVDNWSRILIVRYPSRRAFFELISDPDYLKVMPYKFASLELALTPMTAMTVTPDLRLITGATALIVLLGFGWLRAARRS